MQPEITKIALAPAGPGTNRELMVLRYGKQGAGPKAYIQASLHADETPGMMVAHHLRRLLQDAEVLGEIVLVPYANPIGLSQITHDTLQGRYEEGGKGNFNRNWPDFYSAIRERVKGRLGKEEAKNRKLILTAMVTYLNAWDPDDELGCLRKALSLLAYDANVVLDLHCDDDSLAHLFIVPQGWPEAADLAADLGCSGVMMAEDSGGGSFDECFSSPWIQLAKNHPKAAIPAPPLSVTVELRGSADVSDEQGEKDALAIFHALQRRGIVAGKAPKAAKPLCEATDLTATDIVKAPIAGLLAYKVALGDKVKRGDVIAEVIDPAAEDLGRARLPLHAGTDGVVLSKRAHKWVIPGFSVAKIVGKETLEHRRGYLLEN
jgi:predicted deacylase